MWNSFLFLVVPHLESFPYGIAHPTSPRGAGAAFSSAFPPTSAFWSLIFSSLLLCMLLAAPADPGGGGGGEPAAGKCPAPRPAVRAALCQEGRCASSAPSLPSRGEAPGRAAQQQLLCVALLPVHNGFCLLSILLLPNEVVPPWWQSQPGK